MNTTTTTNTPMVTGSVVAGSVVAGSAVAGSAVEAVEDTGVMVSVRRYTAADLLAVAKVAVLAAGRWLAWLAAWLARHSHWTVAWMVVAGLTWLGDPTAAVWPLLAGVGPGLVCMVWAGVWPSGYERWCAGPARRTGWRVRARRSWNHVARTCGLSARQVVARKKDPATGRRVEVHGEVVPRLRRVRVHANVIELHVIARPGQTAEAIADVVDRVGATYRAECVRARVVSSSRVIIELVMSDLLSVPVVAAGPEPVAVTDRVRLGRTQTGADWCHQVRGRSTLVIGASGAGKGSVLWGLVMGLAPAVHVDMCRLYGVDLKEGIELSFAEPLFSSTAYTVTDAVRTLRLLDQIVTERGKVMRGKTRDFTPTVGDPLHVLVIDELAELVMHGDLDQRREADKLLRSLLARGRALGVVVVACVQDPRKEIVTARNLFGQVICLRVRESTETTMALDAMAARAPAHLIPPTTPGIAWVVDETGNTDRVRADYWSDQIIREWSTRYATTVHTDLPENDGDSDGKGEGGGGSRTTRSRTPRGPRAPRTPRSTVAGAGDGAA
jgi:DNA segregation ATPase FtsK/SpoIIIE, S-DNA-T family